MSLNIQEPSPPDAVSIPRDGSSIIEPANPSAAPLASLLVGARLVVQCKNDWRAATVSCIAPDCVRLLVNSPRGGAYRLRRPHDAPLRFDHAIPLLGDEMDDDATWRDSFAAYDKRW